MIKDVKILPKKQICDKRGKVIHMLRNDDKNFKKFGEIYFSQSNANTIKAWKMNLRMTKNYLCIIGKIKLVLFDDREKSETKGTFQEIFLSTENYKLVIVPPGIWNGFKTLENNEAIIANCSDIPHEPNEIVNKPHDDPYFNYDWNE